MGRNSSKMKAEAMPAAREVEATSAAAREAEAKAAAAREAEAATSAATPEVVTAKAATLDELISSSLTDDLCARLDATTLNALANTTPAFAEEMKTPLFWMRQAALRLPDLPSSELHAALAALETEAVRALVLSPDPVDHAEQNALTAVCALLETHGVVAKITADTLRDPPSRPQCVSLQVTCSMQPLNVAALVKAYPDVRRLSVNHPAPDTDWAALSSLGQLLELSVEGKWHEGRLGDELLDGIQSAIQTHQLRKIALTGCIWPSMDRLHEFIKTNRALSPDAHEINIHRVWAQPALFTDEMVHSLLFRYRSLRRLIIGSCLYELTDNAFKYLRDNKEGVRAGLQLEHIYVCCSHDVTGKGWLLDVDNVRRNLPKFKHFTIAASRHHCDCGARGCGKSLAAIKKVKEACGVCFTNASPHW